MRVLRSLLAAVVYSHVESLDIKLNGATTKVGFQESPASLPEKG